MATKISNKPTRVRLLKEHTHNNVPMKPGEIIALWPDQIEWLASLGVVDATPIVEE